MPEWTREDLEKILKKDFYDDIHVFEEGRRNGDAVDFSIICWCLGLYPEDEYEYLFLKQERKYARNPGLLSVDYIEGSAHMDRVRPYLDKWGKKGTMDAMVYCINYCKM